MSQRCPPTPVRTSAVHRPPNRGKSIGLLAQGKSAEARKEFEAALALAPGFVDPLTQLIALSFAERQPDAALDRVRKQAALLPKSGTHQFLLGETHLARREGKPAEAAYLQALDARQKRRGCARET